MSRRNRVLVVLTDPAELAELTRHSQRQVMPSSVHPRFPEHVSD